MSYLHTRQAALESLYEIEQMIGGFPDEGPVSRLDADLVLQKLRNLYELMLYLQERHEEKGSSGLKADLPTTDPVISLSMTRTEKEHGFDAAKEDHAFIQETVVIKDQTEKTALQNQVRKGDKEPKILSEQYRGRPTLLESLNKQSGRDAETLAQIRPIASLVSAIGINDRFNLIRELFGNDADLFDNVISRLNDAPSFNDAYNIMMQQFDWDMDSEPVQFLLDLVRRKHITSRHG